MGLELNMVQDPNQIGQMSSIQQQIYLSQKLGLAPTGDSRGGGMFIQHQQNPNHNQNPNIQQTMNISEGSSNRNIPMNKEEPHLQQFKPQHQPHINTPNRDPTKIVAPPNVSKHSIEKIISSSDLKSDTSQNNLNISKDGKKLESNDEENEESHTNESLNNSKKMTREEAR